MILEYHRPQSISDALELLARPTPITFPMGGGSTLNRSGGEGIAVVDLQALGLNKIERQGNTLQVGATATLHDLIYSPDVPPVVKLAAHQEANFNLRQVGTLGGTLVSATGRSPLAAVLLAMDAHMTWLPGEIEINLGDWLPMRAQRKPGRLITSIRIPLQARAAYHQVGRTPDDWPLVCASLAVWPSGRRRLVIGGVGEAPLLAMDGADSVGVEPAARNSYSYKEDQWASAEYRQEMAAVLALRCAKEVEGL